MQVTNKLIKSIAAAFTPDCPDTMPEFDWDELREYCDITTGGGLESDQLDDLAAKVEGYINDSYQSRILNHAYVN
jgi:hypothetical protein